jgi:hypothetical protein
MNQAELEKLLKDLQALPKECEWVEFKRNASAAQDIGEYISALSNSARYMNQPNSYLVSVLKMRPIVWLEPNSIL